MHVRSFCLLFWVLVCGIATSGAEPVRSPVNQVFQFSVTDSVPYEGSTTPKTGTLYLWIPESCAKLRGLVILGNNVPEHMLAGHPAIREACRANDLGLVWSVPTFWNFAKQMKGREAEQVAFLQKLLDGLASVSGYDEVSRVPWLPIGESGHLLMVCGLIDQQPERCIAGICVKNPHSPKNRTVPLLWTLGTAQEWGQKDKDIRTEWNAAGPGYEGWVKGRAESSWPLSMVIEPGTGHFSCSDALARYFGATIGAAAAARIAEDGSLRPVDLNAGFLAHLPLTPGEDLRIIPYAVASPEERKRAWFFTESLAREAQDISRTNWQANTQLVGLVPVENCESKPFSFNSVTELLVVTESTFSVKGTLLPEIPDGFVGAGEKLASTPGEPVVEWICGPYAPVGNGTFRVALDRTWKSGGGNYLIARKDGDDKVRTSVQPCAVKLVENKEGTPQVLTFDKIPDVPAGTVSVPLSAKSDSGLPVQFSVLTGPAVIENGNLVFTPIPPRAKFPVEVTVAAWQWGRPTDPKVRMSEFVKQTFRIVEP